MTKEVLERFFKKQCNAEEAKQVAIFLKKNQAVLNEYLDENEWDTTQPDLSLPQEFWDEVWTGITKKKKTDVVILWSKRTAVAVAFVGIISFSFYNQKKSGNIKSTTSNILASNKISPQYVEHKIVTNNLKKADDIMLEDGSTIKLYPGSQVRYDIPFQHNKREIYLEGEAYFKVAKDKTKPFSVYAGSLLTTALGTEFKITTKKNAPGDVSVKLFTGKVAITSPNPVLKGWSKDVYLLPGQQMNYDANKMFVLIDKINKNKIDGKVLSKNLVSINNDLTFNGAALPYVINTLSKYFTTKIEFNKSQVRNMSFTGVITKNDSLQNVLKVIGQMNDLEIAKKNSGFSIQKISK